MQSLKLATYNVNGLNNPVKRGTILSKLKKDKVQIAYLQETHLNAIEHAKLNRMGIRHVFSSSDRSGHKRGVAILLARGVNYEHMSELTDSEGRYVMIIGKLEGTLVSLLNVYAPPGCGWLFYRKILNMMTTKAQGVVICGGDFNIHLNPKLDTSTGKSVTKRIGTRMTALMKELGIVDIWRELYSTTRDYTYYSAPHAVYTRIDYFFAFSRDLHKIERCDIGPITLSDHSPVFISLSLNGEQRSTLWRLNSSILNIPDTKEYLIAEINSFFDLNDTGEVSPGILWDTLKAVMRGRIIAITSSMKKRRKQKLEDLETKLKHLQRAHSVTLDERDKQEIKEIRTEIEKMSIQEIQNKFIFLKQRYYEVGGKAMKLLAYKLKKQQADNTIPKIRNPESGEVEHRLGKIQQSFEKYYKTLYSQQHTDNAHHIDTFLASLDLPSISEEQNERLASDITSEELDAAISRLKADKSPGPDGFTAEWYKSLRAQLVPRLLETFNWVLKENRIPPSWKDATISLIPKEGKDKLECGSFRPISVLNVDYKLFTSILAHRIDKLLPDLIHTDQTGFIRQRQTQDNLRRTLHIISHITQNDTEAMLISLDAEKAFDSVRWSFLYKVLEKFGFHRSIIDTFRALYDSPSARIKVNGALSKAFTLERGTRQGCPASPLLFALFIEPLSQWIRQNSEIKGISVHTAEHKLALFADDVLVYLSQPTLTFPKLMTVLERYGALSGYKLNVQKTQVLTFNYDPPSSLVEKYQLKWGADHIRYLGVNLSKDILNLFTLNYGPLNNNIKSDIQRWSLIPFLGLHSRVESIRMNVLPRLLYLFQSLPVEIPIEQFMDWDKMISRFLWGGKKPRIRYKTLQLHKDGGGLGLPCLRDYFYAAQLRPLVCWCNPSYSARWKDIENNMTHQIPLAAVMADNKLMNGMMENNNPWINATLKTWQKTIKLCDLEHTLKTLRWCAFDTDFSPNRLDFRFKTWIEGGLTTYYSFVNKGTFKSFEMLQREHGLQRQDFYRYLQVRHYFKENIARVLEGQRTGILEVFRGAISSSICNKVVSSLYRVIRQASSDNTFYIREKWEKEGNLPISAEEWESICKLQWETTCSNTWREYSWKNLTRFFITPLQQRTQMPSTACWRSCGANEANHFHVFWDCPVLTPYWREIHSHLEAIFRVHIPCRFDTLYIGNLSFDLWDYGDKKLLLILLVASKKAISRRWLKQDPPTIGEWLDVVHDIYTMEKLSYSLKIQVNTFMKIWSKWTGYVNHNGLRSDFV